MREAAVLSGKKRPMMTTTIDNSLISSHRGISRSSHSRKVMITSVSNLSI